MTKPKQSTGRFLSRRRRLPIDLADVELDGRQKKNTFVSCDEDDKFTTPAPFNGSCGDGRVGE